MQEINYGRQESSARSSPIASSEEVAEVIFGRAGSASEDKEDEPAGREYMCRVCDSPVEWPHIVCRECWDREQKEQEWESYLDFLDGDDTTPGNPESSAEDRSCRSIHCERPMLIVLCGPSHTGKSAFARKLRRNFTIISSDEIRKRLTGSFRSSKDETKVWNVFESMKCKALKEGRNVILDACHMSKRARWHSVQGPNARYRKICVVFDLPFRTIRERCLKEKRVPLKEVKRMWRDFQRSKPTREELRSQGFDEVYFVKEWPLAMQSRGIWRMAHHPGEAGRFSPLWNTFLPVIDFFLLHTSCAHASTHTFCFAASPPWLCWSKADGSLRQFRFGGVSLWKKSKMQSKKAVLRTTQCIKSWLRKETTP